MGYGLDDTRWSRPLLGQGKGIQKLGDDLQRALSHARSWPCVRLSFRIKHIGDITNQTGALYYGLALAEWSAWRCSPEATAYALPIPQNLSTVQDRPTMGSNFVPLRVQKSAQADFFRTPQGMLSGRCYGKCLR